MLWQHQTKGSPGQKISRRLLTLGIALTTTSIQLSSLAKTQTTPPITTHQINQEQKRTDSSNEATAVHAKNYWISHARSNQKSKLSGKLKSDPIISHLKEEDREVLDHFGIEAPKILQKYANFLCTILIRHHLKARCRAEEIPSLLDQTFTEGPYIFGEYFNSVSKETTDALATFGVNSFRRLNAYALYLEDLLVSSGESGYIDKRSVRDINRIIAELGGTYLQQDWSQPGLEKASGYDPIRSVYTLINSSQYDRAIDLARDSRKNPQINSIGAMRLAELETLALIRSGQKKEAAKSYRSFFESRKRDVSALDKLKVMLNLIIVEYLAKNFQDITDLIEDSAKLRHAIESDWLREVSLQRNRQFLNNMNEMEKAVYTGLSLKDEAAIEAVATMIVGTRFIVGEVEFLQLRSMRQIPGGRASLHNLSTATSKASHMFANSNEKIKAGRLIEDLMRDLLAKLPTDDTSLVHARQIRNQLLAGEAVAIFFKYNEYADLMPWGNSEAESSYGVILISRDLPTQFVRIGRAIDIDLLIARAITSSAELHTDAEKLLTETLEQVLLPIENLLGREERIYILADGEVGRLPIAIGGTLSKKIRNERSFQLITSTKDLVRFRSESTSKQEMPLVMAAPYFGKQVTNIERKRQTHLLRNQGKIPELLGRSWPSLQNTLEEGSVIAKIIGARLLTGKEATVKALSELGNPKVLHIASHGFFHEQQLEKGTPDAYAEYASNGLRSGIVLAGANQISSDSDDDGYLTATEALFLDLDGTELVVLSACSTGRGNVQTGEGIYGLQRSLTVAGARSTLLSLWKVDDAATAEFMIRFYKRIREGESRIDAVLETQKDFRDGTAGNGQWKEPFYWAAWQLVGDWRPIKGL